MADTDEPGESTTEDAPKKSSKMPMILGFVLALAGGGGGFYAVSSGMILGGESHHEEAMDDTHDMEDMSEIAFVEVAPMVIPLGQPEARQHLRFRAQLEVPSQYQMDVEKLLPRVVDVLNGYLRALEARDLQDNAALIRLRAQMLRRVQIVTGAGRINDLLIMEFVLN